MFKHWMTGDINPHLTNSKNEIFEVDSVFE